MRKHVTKIWLFFVIAMALNIHPSLATASGSNPFFGCSVFVVTVTSNRSYVRLGLRIGQGDLANVFAVTPGVTTTLIWRFQGFDIPQNVPVTYSAQGLLSYSPYDPDGDSYFSETTECSDNAYNNPGRAIPADFELKTIVCNTPIYDAPNGNVVTGTKITSGQTWYVGSTSIHGFTEIYASGDADGFIPSKCIQ